MKKIKKHKITKTKITVIFLSIVTIVISLLINSNLFFGISSKTIYSFFGINEFSSKADSYPLSVHFIDVGCGDCIFIKCNNKTALIDTGNFSINEKAKYYLEHNEVKKLDLFIASHTDSDHIGDFSSIADNFKIEKLWINEFCIPKEENKTETEKEFFDKISEYNIQTVYPKAGESYSLGDAELQVIAPLNKYENQNDNSLVIKLIYKDVSFLFTGDAGKDSENEMLLSDINLKSAVLKLSHHGSKSATTEEFLNAVAPQYAVISAGDENKYLPNREVVDRLNDFGAEILRTDVDGSIIIATDGKTIKTFKENEE